MWSGMNTASVSLPHESETDSCQRPRSSLTCVSSHSPVPLTSTEDLRTWLRQVSPASRSASQESSKLPTTAGICGPLQRTLFAAYSLDPYSLRTCPDLFPAAISEPSSVTWPRWGMWGGGEYWALSTPERPTNATGSGSWPTPVADGDRTTNYAQGGASLGFAVRNWPTPTATDYKGSPVGQALERRRSMTRGVRLPEQVARRMVPTPTTPRPHDSANTAGKFMPNQRQHDLTAYAASNGGQLNPTWVEWLMGWPLGWTDLKPLETVKFRQWSRSHGGCWHESAQQ
jgi:hypothetical protein